MIALTLAKLIPVDTGNCKSLLAISFIHPLALPKAPWQSQTYFSMSTYEIYIGVYERHWSILYMAFVCPIELVTCSVDSLKLFRHLL